MRRLLNLLLPSACTNNFAHKIHRKQQQRQQNDKRNFPRRKKDCGGRNRRQGPWAVENVRLALEEEWALQICPDRAHAFEDN